PGMRNSEKGVALLVVIVLTAVALAIMTTLIYMITSGTRMSGMQKRYKTALEAGKGGADLFYQVIALRGEQSGQTSFLNTVNAYNLNTSVTNSAGCSGTSGGTTYTGIQAKMMTSSSTWVGCDSSITINPSDPNSYDMKSDLGSNPKYTVYTKVVAASDGNSGGDLGLLNKGVISANTGEVSVMSIPYLYAVEVVSENADNPDERAKLSILYQY
ncbi:MAG TPA: pilus assembly PilX N-terminal domain-containing protein, partial [Nitrospirota bacterium]